MAVVLTYLAALLVSLIVVEAVVLPVTQQRESDIEENKAGIHFQNLNEANPSNITDEAGATSFWGSWWDNYYSHSPECAFKENARIGWCSSGSKMPQSIWKHFIQPLNVYRISFQRRRNGNDLDVPTKVDVFGSNDDDCANEASWVTLATDDSVKLMSREDTWIIDIPNSRIGSFRCYGIRVKDASIRSNGEKYACVSHIKFYSHDADCSHYTDEKCLRDHVFTQKWLCIDHCKQAFESKAFFEKYNKTYENEAEAKKRKAIFKENYAEIENHNKLYYSGKSSFRMGVNEFSDLTYDEVINQLTGVQESDIVPPLTRMSEVSFYNPKNMGEEPEYLDYREQGAMNPIRNQKAGCGSCWAFTAVANIESNYFIKSREQVQMSEQDLVDCDTMNYGCTSGSIFNAFKYVMKKGVGNRSEYEYTAKEGTCKDVKRIYPVKGIKIINNHQESELLNALVHEGPISVNLWVSKKFRQHIDGVFSDDCKRSVNHGMLLVGYGTEKGKDYWLLRNSWGETWGEKGYIKMARNVENDCGISSSWPMFPVITGPPYPLTPVEPLPTQPPVPGPPPVCEDTKKYEETVNGITTLIDSCQMAKNMCENGWCGMLNQLCNKNVVPECKKTCGQCGLTFSCEPECVNGACIGPNTCTCNAGWHGAQCEKDKNSEFIAGPEGIIWYYEICPEIERLSVRLEECMDECSRRDKCTAFHFNVDSSYRNCELLMCPQPIPEPTWKYGRSWIGYSIHNVTAASTTAEVEECKDLNSECWSFDVNLCFTPQIKDQCPKKCGVCVEPGPPLPATSPPPPPPITTPPPTEAPACQCGVASTSRIIGGNEVTPMRKYPWQVGIGEPRIELRKDINIDLTNARINKCGGTIINDRWILSAAHCFTDQTTCKLKYDSSTSLRVWVGEHNLASTSDDVTDTKEYSIKTFIIHPDYDCKLKDEHDPYSNQNNDFALLELTEPIPFNNVISPICLPQDDSETYAGQIGTVTGWGWTSWPFGIKFYLKELQVPIHSNDDCGFYSQYYGPRPASFICAGGEKGKSACKADSGGPLLVVENNKYVQVGVASYRKGCGLGGWPTIFARVSTVLPWITETTASGRKCT